MRMIIVTYSLSNVRCELSRFIRVNARTVYIIASAIQIDTYVYQTSPHIVDPSTGTASMAWKILSCIHVSALIW